MHPPLARCAPLFFSPNLPSHLLYGMTLEREEEEEANPPDFLFLPERATKGVAVEGLAAAAGFPEGVNVPSSLPCFASGRGMGTALREHTLLPSVGLEREDGGREMAQAMLGEEKKRERREGGERGERGGGRGRQIADDRPSSLPSPSTLWSRPYVQSSSPDPFPPPFLSSRLSLSFSLPTHTVLLEEPGRKERDGWKHSVSKHKSFSSVKKITNGFF